MHCFANEGSSAFSDKLSTVLYISSFWIIFIRDLSTLLITCFFCWRVNKNINKERQESGFKSKLGEQPEDPDKLLLRDFALMLESHLPNLMFGKYLETEKPELVPLMQIIIKYKLRDKDLSKIENPQTSSF